MATSPKEGIFTPVRLARIGSAAAQFRETCQKFSQVRGERLEFIKEHRRKIESVTVNPPKNGV